jgi:hypothetical protein
VQLIRCHQARIEANTYFTCHEDRRLWPYFHQRRIQVVRAWCATGEPVLSRGFCNRLTVFASLNHESARYTSLSDQKKLRWYRVRAHTIFRPDEHPDTQPKDDCLTIVFRGEDKIVPAARELAESFMGLPIPGPEDLAAMKLNMFQEALRLS